MKMLVLAVLILIAGIGLIVPDHLTALAVDNPVMEAPFDQPTDEATMIPIRLQIGAIHFAATLYDNAATQALQARMPLTLMMSELNGNEKYHFMADTLPTEAGRVGRINAGDLMLYGADCLVLFYESFSTSYRYTKLGRVEDTTGLAEALGAGDVAVTFDFADSLEP